MGNVRKCPIYRGTRLTRRKGSSNAEVAARQRKVLSCYLKGFSSEEMAALLHVNARTIRRDLEELKVHIAQEVQAADLYSLRRAFLELEEEWREAWILYHRPTPQGKHGPVDDRIPKLLVLDRIIRLTEAKTKLAGLYAAAESQPATPNVEPAERAEIVRDIVRNLTGEEQVILAKAIRRIEGLEPGN